METPKLSPAKINPTKLLPGISISEKKISTQNLQEESISVLKSDLFIIKKQVFKIRDLIQTSTLIKQSELEKKRKSTEKKGAEEQENKLEAKPEKKEGKLKMPSAPKLGFLDRIKNFLFSVLLGYISIKLLPHLPKLVGIVSIIGNVMEFMIDLGGNILDKVVTFIDWGYKAIDATRGFMKSFGGDFSLKIFDTFTGAVGGVIDAAIIVAIALSTQGMGGGGGPDGGRPRVGGKGAGRVDPGVARRYAERFGKDAALKKFGKEGLGKLGGRYARSGVTNLARKGLVGLAGKGGAKAVLGFAKPFLKRLPIIGALIDFGLSVALGEDPGRAAFKAIGAGLLGFVGAAIGGPFAILTGLAGGAAGDWAGGALYDAFFGGKKPKAQKPQAVKAAGGGPAPVTRGNKIVGGAVKRTISRKPVKRGVKVQVTKVKPGGSIGGKKKIEKIFPEVPIKDKGKNVNPLGYMQSSYNIATKTPSFGALFALPLKAQLGEKPSSVDYMKAAEELSGWMQNTFRGTAGYAGGGKVEAGMFGGEDTTNVIAKSLEENISSKVDAAIKELQKQLMLKEGEKETGQKKTVPDGVTMDDDEGGGGLTSGQWGPILDVISSVESSGGSYDSRFGGIYPGYSKLTIEQANAVQLANYKKWGSSASGKYQFMDISGQAKYAGLKPTDLFSPENQDKMAIALIEKKRYGKDWLSGKITDSKFAEYLAMEWAGLPRGNDNLSFYHGDGVNKAHTTFDKVLNALKKVRGGGYSQQELAGSITAPTTKDAQSLSRGAITSYFGSKESFRKKGHEGVDIGLNQGTALSFKMKGTVIDAFRTSSTDREAGGGYGSYMDVKLENGNILRLAHLSKIYPQTKFEPGNVVALSGGTPGYPGSGRSGGPHLHLEQHSAKIGTQETLKGKLDPVKYGGFGLIQTGGTIKKFAKGGRVNRPTFALIGEKGKEFIFDANTTSGLDAMVPYLLDRLNAANTKREIMRILQSYAGYEDGAEQTVIVMNNPQMVPIPIPTGNSGSIGGMSRSSSIDTTYDIQYANA